MTAIVVMTAAVLLACGDGPRASGSTITAGELTTSNAFIGTSGGQIAAGYLTIENPGPRDRVMSISSPDADRIGHMGAMGGDGSVEATSSEPITIPADGLLELRPGGAHLMIEGLRETLSSGDTVRLRLTFERAPIAELTATAVDVADIPDLLDTHDSG